MMQRTALSLLLLLLSVTSVLATSGVKGRIAWRGELVPGVKVRAYLSIPDIAAGKVVATSAPAAVDGTYRLDLPPGSYYLTARDYEGEPHPGNHFCYYSGAPILVQPKSFTNVGFNLIRIPVEASPIAGKRSGIRGEISYQGELLGRVYLYVYKEAKDGFKGPGYFIQPVEKGRFRLRLPPGEYYLLARKRLKGGQYGPIEIGDYFNYYYGNPVTIRAGEEQEVKIETVTRLSMLEEGETVPFRGVQGVVTGPGGAPAKGVVVFAYRRPEMTGTPDLFSPPSGDDGHFQLVLPDLGPYYLLAREAFGGPAGEGELYGRYDKEGITLDPEHPIREVTIHVERKRTP